MPTYETTKFLSLPQQVNKNKNDIKELQDNQADISNLIPNTEKGQPLGVATLDATGKVPSAQLPSNPGNFLPLAGGTMAGNIDMDGNEIVGAVSVDTTSVFTNNISSNNPDIKVVKPIDMENNKIVDVAKGTSTKDVATVENINDHNTSPFAHADIRNLISAIQGAYIYRGVINENTVDVTQLSLTNRLTALMSRAPILGDVLTDLDRTDWYFDGTSWDNMGQTFVVIASAVNDGLMSKEDYTKLYDLYTKAQLDAILNAKEALTNKATDFSVVNDTKYPTTKAVADALALKANIAQEAWITPTLVNSWVQFGSPTYNASYMKDSMGFVHLRGRIKDGVVGQYAFVLPIGYRSTNTMSFAVDSNNAFGKLLIASDGSVSVSTGSNTFASLDGITFKAEA